MIHSSDVGSTQFSNTLLQLLSVGASLLGGGLLSANSDLELAQRILVEIALKTKRVLAIPSPCVRFHSMIDNAVHLKLRVWICDPQNGLSEIQSAIIFSAWKAFRSNNIKVPYPPREIYSGQSQEEVTAGKLITQDEHARL